jgi:hypothetical protein
LYSIHMLSLEDQVSYTVRSKTAASTNSSSASLSSLV